MSHLPRIYTDYYYREDRKRNLVKHSYMKRDEFAKLYPFQPIPDASGVFPCKHEERGFVSERGRKSNHTRTRMKRRNKARIKARKCA